MYNPNQARNNHGEFGTTDVPLKGEAAVSAVVTKPRPPQPEDHLAKTPEEAEAHAKAIAEGYKPLEGLPQKPIQLGDHWYVPGPIGFLKDAAEAYMSKAGLPYNPPTTYAKLDKDRATKIADAFEHEKNDPNDPEVKRSYEALARETLAQWEALKGSGVKVEWVKPGMQDPYADSPRLAAMDVAENKHWWGFPTDLGHGSDEESKSYDKDNPLMKAVPGEEIDGRPVLVNDVFRIVHDMFGHLKEGNGFRAEGEENAWRSHAAMFSDEALPAMTNETRGQNSWLNYGPYGESNRHAKSADTHFAPQKVGKLPDWAWKEGRT